MRTTRIERITGFRHKPLQKRYKMTLETAASTSTILSRAEANNLHSIHGFDFEVHFRFKPHVFLLKFHQFDSVSSKTKFETVKVSMEFQSFEAPGPDE